MTALGNLFPPVASLATAPLLARGLGVDGRGEVAAIVAPLLLVTLVAQMGVPVALSHFVARSPGAERVLLARGTRLLLLAGLAATVLLLASAPLITGGDPGRSSLLALSALGVVPSVVVASFQAVAVGLHRWRLVAAERFVSSAARLLAIAGLALAGRLDIVLAVVALSLAPAVGGLVYVGLLAEKRLRARPRVSRESAPSILRYGLPVWFGSVSGVLLARLDQVVMVPLADAEQLGIYAVAVVVGELPLIANSAVRDVTLVDRSATGDAAGLEVTARLSTLVVAGVSAVIAGSSFVVVPWAFGSGFAAAVPMALLVLLGSLLGNPGSVAGAGLAALGRPGLRSLALGVAGVVNLALLLVFVPLWGGLGAAVASVAGCVLASHLNIVFLRRVSSARARDFYGVRISDLGRMRRAGRLATAGGLR